MALLRPVGRNLERRLRVGLGRSSVESSDGCTLDAALCISKILPPGRTASAPQEVGNHIKLLAFLMALPKMELQNYMTLQIVMIAMRSRPGHQITIQQHPKTSKNNGKARFFTVFAIPRRPAALLGIRRESWYIRWYGRDADNSYTNEHTNMALSDLQIRNAKPGAKRIKLSDGGGLQLWIEADGAKRWRLAYPRHEVAEGAF
jgi:Arm DNA-binding domain